MFLTSLLQRVSPDGDYPAFLVEFFVVLQVHFLAALYLVKEFYFWARHYGRWCRIWSEFNQSYFNNRASKVALLTGGDGTIGRELVKILLARGWTIHIVTSDRLKATTALIVDQVPHSSDTKLALHECDLRDLKAVANFAQTFKDKNRQIDLFIGNAGVLHPRDSWTDHAAVDGMNVNVVAHAALIEILRPVLARDHRVLLMGSCCSHACLATNRIKTDSSFLYDAHGPYQAYAFSKLLLAVYGEMHAQSMHITHPGATLCVVHPGVVPSALYRKTNPLTRLAIGYMLPLIARSAEDAAILSLHTAFREDVKSGLYFEDGQPTSVGRDLEKATKMAMYARIQSELRKTLQKKD